MRHVSQPCLVQCIAEQVTSSLKICLFAFYPMAVLSQNIMHDITLGLSAVRPPTS